MGRRIMAVLLLMFAIGAVAPSASAQGRGGGGNNTCPPGTPNAGNPPPCGGGGGGGGGGGNNTCPPGTPNAGNPPPCGNANGYPPQIIEIDCLKVFGDIRLGSVPTVKLGGNVTLLAPPGCLVGGHLVVVVILSEPRVIGQARALEDGSVQINGTIPSDLPAGTHNLSVRVQGQPEAVRAVKLVPDLKQPQTLAAANTKTSSPSGVGMLALWALLIVGGGAVLATFGWRRVRARPAGAGFLPRRDNGPTVPRIDTSGFVPGTRSDAPGEVSED